MRHFRPFLAYTCLLSLSSLASFAETSTLSKPVAPAAPPKVTPPTKLQALLASPPKFYFWPASSAPSHWQLSAGFVWRNLGDLEFHSFSNGIASGAPFVLPAGSSRLSATGAGSGFSSRTYDDGYVNPDSGTSFTADTAFWGYTSASQVAGNSISFHGVGPSHTEIAQRLSLDSDPGWSDGLAAGGPMITLNYEQEWSKHITLGLDFSVSLLALHRANEGSSFFSEITMNHFTSRVTDSYGTGGGVLPPPPHSGTAGPGPLILATPSRVLHESLANSESFYVFDSIEESLDFTLTTLSLGPTASYQRGQLRALFGYGLALNIVSWDAFKRDTIYAGTTLETAQVIAQWRDAESGTDVLPGFYLQSSLAYEIDERWSCSVFGRYDWSRKLKGEVGGSTFALDLSGWSAGLMLSYRF